MQELVVLVNDENIPIGTADKRSVHTTDTPLHRAFSLFLFNSKHEVLLTKRAKTKKTFPGVWTNTVCGHVAPDETSADAVARRLREELGITGVLVAEVSPYRYRFADASGIVENEICPIFTGYFDGNPVPVPDEVDEWKWVPWEEFLNDTRSRQDPYSPWCREEAEIIDRILRRKDPETR